MEYNEQPSFEQDKNEKSTSVERSKSILSYLHDLVFGLAAVLLIFMFIFRILVVSGPSMEGTLFNGDCLILVSNIFYNNPKYGDIVVASKNSFKEGEPIIKRVIATEGQKVDIDFENAVVKINDKVINEPYLGSPTKIDEGAWDYPITLKEGQLFVMGDNRMHSSDSRSPDIGLINEKYILGQVLMRFSPINEIKFFGDYDYE